MSNFKKKIGIRIKNARTLKGFTQEQLAEHLDVSVSCISRFETGTSIPSIKMLLKLAETLDVGVEYLLYDYVTNHVVTDPLTSEILVHVEPMPDHYKKHILDIISSIYRNLPPEK